MRVVAPVEVREVATARNCAATAAWLGVRDMARETGGSAAAASGGHPTERSSERTSESSRDQHTTRLSLLHVRPRSPRLTSAPSVMPCALLLATGRTTHRCCGRATIWCASNADSYLSCVDTDAQWSRSTPTKRDTSPRAACTQCCRQRSEGAAHSPCKVYAHTRWAKMEMMRSHGWRSVATVHRPARRRWLYSGRSRNVLPTTLTH